MLRPRSKAYTYQKRVRLDASAIALITEASASYTPNLKRGLADMAKQKIVDFKEEEAIIEKPVEAKIYRRNMSGMKDILTDLFKLTVSTVVKYEGWDEKNEHPVSHPTRFSQWEHTHPFRTYDKKGDKVFTSTPIAGHFHVIEWEESTDPEVPPKIKSVSGPMVMGKQKVKGLVTNVPVPANDYDEHTHDVEYLRTAKITFNSANAEAAKVVAYEASKFSSIPGVTER